MIVTKTKGLITIFDGILRRSIHMPPGLLGGSVKKSGGKNTAAITNYLSCYLCDSGYQPQQSMGVASYSDTTL